MPGRKWSPSIAILGYVPGGELSGLAQMQAFAKYAKEPSMRHTFGVSLPKVELGQVVCEAEPTPKALNSMGGIHGGYIAMLLDSVCGNAVHTMLEPRQTYATVEIKVSFIRPVKLGAGPVRAIGKVVSVGEKIAFAEGHLYDAKDKLLASASSTIAIVYTNK
jgi:uncharacterized protein (TIGR00369 family)